MLATAAVTAAVVIPAGIGWLTRFGNVDWERLALRLLDRDRDDLEPQIKPLATRRLNEENAARQAQSASGLLRFELPPRPVSDNPQLDAARAAEYTALRQRCEVEQATWNAEHRRWQRARAPLAAALVQADLEGPRADARRPPGEGEGNAAAEEAESAAEQTLAQCAPDGSGARGEAWLGYEEVGELRERQRRAFMLRWNARLRAALEEQTRERERRGGGGGGEAAAAALRQGGGGGGSGAAWGGVGEAGQGVEEWASPGLLRVEARPIGVQPRPPG